jgi:hypothetical protein
MLIDLRVYTYLPGKFRKFLRGYEDIGFALTSRHLGKTLGIFTAESGIQNRTFQFFMYEGQTHRDRCRKGMVADPDWHAFVKIDGDALLQQMNTLLKPTAYSPIGGSEVAPPALIVDGSLRLFELRTWTFLPQGFDEALNMIGENAKMAARFTPHLIGYFVAETGAGAQLLRLTGYDGGEHRDNQMALERADADMRYFVTSIKPLLAHEDTTLLRPTAYSPLR